MAVCRPAQNPFVLLVLAVFMTLTVTTGQATAPAAGALPAQRTGVPADALDPQRVASTGAKTAAAIRHHHGPARRALTPAVPGRSAATRPAIHRQPAIHHHHDRHPGPAPVHRGPTDWGTLNAAIGRIPDHAARRVDWVVSSRYGHWGTADWYRHVIYISPTTPSDLVYSVAVHEWSHLLAVIDYDDDVSATVDAINAHFGGAGASGYNGVENAADCMSLEQGATWTHYTSCHDHHWRSMARRLLAGHQL